MPGVPGGPGKAGEPGGPRKPSQPSHLWKVFPKWQGWEWLWAVVVLTSGRECDYIVG